MSRMNQSYSYTLGFFPFTAQDGNIQKGLELTSKIYEFQLSKMGQADYILQCHSTQGMKNRHLRHQSYVLLTYCGWQLMCTSYMYNIYVNFTPSMLQNTCGNFFPTPRPPTIFALFQQHGYQIGADTWWPTPF